MKLVKEEIRSNIGLCVSNCFYRNVESYASHRWDFKYQSRIYTVTNNMKRFILFGFIDN